METKRRNHSAHRNETTHIWLHKIVTLSAAFTVLLLAVSAAGWADAFYTIAASQSPAVVLMEDETVPQSEDNPLYISRTAASWDVTLAAGQNVTIRHGEDVQTVVSRQERLSILLERLHIEVSPEEMISVNLSAPDGPEITISMLFLSSRIQVPPLCLCIALKSPRDGFGLHGGKHHVSRQ